MKLPSIRGHICGVGACVTRARTSSSAGAGAGVGVGPGRAWFRWWARWRAWWRAARGPEEPAAREGDEDDERTHGGGVAYHGRAWPRCVVAGASVPLPRAGRSRDPRSAMPWLVFSALVLVTSVASTTPRERSHRAAAGSSSTLPPVTAGRAPLPPVERRPGHLAEARGRSASWC